MTWIAVMVGGALGAGLRFFSSRAFASQSDDIPMGTLVANTVASLIMGFVAVLPGSAAALGPLPRALVATGLAGGLSTFSTFAYETTHMMQSGDTRNAVVNIALNVLLGLAAVAIGMAGASLLA